MKRFVRAEIISAIMSAAVAAASVSCTWIPENQPVSDAIIAFRIEETKAGVFPDTNSFTLRVVPAGGGGALYEGPYGKRPAELKVPAGSYEAGVYSCDFRAPAFDTPLYSDEQLVIARSGERLAVNFICKTANSGIRLKLSERFKSRYPGKILLRQSEGQLPYEYGEKRTAWMYPGQVSFLYSDGTSENLLFKRNILPGEINELSLDASANETGSEFSISVDTTLVRKEESIVVGAAGGGDGLSLATAYSASQLSSAGCDGDTVWVCGYIVGALNEAGEIDFTCEGNVSPNAVIIADDAQYRNPEECAALNLTKTAHKAELSLDRPENKAEVFHRRIYVRGKAVTYKKFPALTNICEYIIEKHL